MKQNNKNTQNSKHEDLQQNKTAADDQLLTTNQGVKINDNNNSLKAGERKPS